jgi:hypothetical protein
VFSSALARSTLIHCRDTMAKPTTKDARAFAKEHLGFGRLRPGQEEAIMAVLQGRDTLAIELVDEQGLLTLKDERESTP